MDSQGTIMFKVVPNEAPAGSSCCPKSVRSSQRGCSVGPTGPGLWWLSPALHPGVREGDGGLLPPAGPLYPLP